MMLYQQGGHVCVCAGQPREGGRVERVAVSSLWGNTNILVSDTQVTGGVWNFSRVCCDVFVTLDVMMCTASILNLCAISIDR